MKRIAIMALATIMTTGLLAQGTPPAAASSASPAGTTATKHSQSKHQKHAKGTASHKQAKTEGGAQTKPSNTPTPSPTPTK